MRDLDPLLFVRAANRVGDAFRAPSILVWKEIVRQIHGLLDPYASVTEVAFIPAEQVSCGCVVQIDVELVREEEFDAAEGIRRSGILTNGVLRAFGESGRHVMVLHLRRVLRRAGVHMHVALGEVVGVDPDGISQFFLGNARGNVPRGVEHDVRHRVAEDGGPAVLLSHDDSHCEDRATSVHHVESVVRNVHEDVPRPERSGEPAPAFHVELDLTDALGCRHVEVGQLVRAHDSRLLEAAPPLEVPHGCFQ